MDLFFNRRTLRKGKSLCALCAIFMLALVFLGMCGGQTVYAETLTSGDYQYELDDDGNVIITKYIGKGGAVVVPATIDDKPVVTIGERAFFSKDNITSLEIPEGVTKLEQYSLYYTSKLTTLKLPSTVTNIDEYTIKYCEELENIEVASANTSFKTVGGVLFSADMSRLIVYPALKADTTYNIPAGVKTIEGEAFYHVQNLKILNVTEGVTEFQSNAVMGCANLEEINLPDSFNTFGMTAIYDCDKLVTITIPVNVKKIGWNVFNGCDALKSIEVAEDNDYFKDIDGVLCSKDGTIMYRYPIGKAGTTYAVPEGVETLECSVFEDCTNLTDISLPSTLKKIGMYVFQDCDGLPSLVVPEGVTEVGTNSFANCNKLTSIKLPNSLTTMKANAFKWCSSDLVVSVCCGSYAEQFAIDNSLAYNSIKAEMIASEVTIDKAQKKVIGTVYPIGSADAVWTSSDESVVTVDSWGVVTGVGAGTATIKVVVAGTDTVTCKVTVTDTVYVPTLVSAVTLDEESVTVASGKTVQLTATVAPDNADIKTVVWSSSDTTVATVYATGLVTAVAPGTVTISVKAIDGSDVGATCVVTVTELITSVEITGVIEPVVGAKASFNCLVPANANYEVAYEEGDECNYGMWLVSDFIPASLEEIYYIEEYYYCQEELIFEKGKYYTFVPFIFAKKGYEFASTVTATVNGNVTDAFVLASVYLETYYTFTPKEVAEDPVVAFVERMYTVALKRETIDAEGLANWVAQLKGGVLDGAGIAQNFILGEEFAIRGFSNEEFLDILYLTFFNRGADADGKAFWLSVLEAGNSRSFVLSNFVNLDEFTIICANYGIERGLMLENGTAVNPGIPQFVKRLYTIALGRDADNEGLKNYVLALLVKAETAESVAKNFLVSAEYNAGGKDDNAFVKDLYSVFMNRTPSEEDVEFWVATIALGMGREGAISEFAKSAEFKTIAAGYGLE